LELGTSAAPTAWNHPTFANAPQFSFPNDIAAPPCAGRQVAKLLWEDGSTKWGYLSVDCTEDAQLTTSNAESDTSSYFGASVDKAAFLWRSPADILPVFDGGLRFVRASPDDKYADGRWLDTERALTFEPSYLSVVTGEVVAGASWKLFMKFDLGSIDADAVGLCQLTLFDKDAGQATASAHWKGSSDTDASQFGRCRFSSRAVVASTPGVPRVTAFTIPAATITRTAAVGKADTDAPGTCTLRIGASSGAYALQSAGVPSQNGTCNASINGLTAGTTYFGVMEVSLPMHGHRLERADRHSVQRRPWRILPNGQSA
jgi:hypothetical protein